MQKKALTRWSGLNIGYDQPDSLVEANNNVDHNYVVNCFHFLICFLKMAIKKALTFLSGLLNIFEYSISSCDKSDNHDCNNN